MLAFHYKLKVAEVEQWWVVIWLLCYIWFIAIDHPTAIFVEVFLRECVNHLEPPPQKKNCCKNITRRDVKRADGIVDFPSLVSNYDLRSDVENSAAGALPSVGKGETFAPDLSGLTFVDVRSDHGWKKREGCCSSQVLVECRFVCGIHDFWAWLALDDCFAKTSSKLKYEGVALLILV